MVKKILLISAFAAIVSTNLAHANAAPYVGAGVGIINNTANVKLNNRPVDYVGGSYRGVPVNLFAGYGGAVNENFYLAGEIFGTAGTMNLSDSKGLKTSYGIGAAIIPGVMLSDHTMAYVRAGVVRARFSQSKANKTGGQFGAGMQTTLTQNVDLRGEYDFVAYKSEDKTIGTNKFSIAPRSDQFNVGLVYKFD